MTHSITKFNTYCRIFLVARLSVIMQSVVVPGRGAGGPSFFTFVIMLNDYFRVVLANFLKIILRSLSLY
jgi:hypothetical protein